MTNENLFSYGNRTAVITGGSKNIGLAIAEKFLQAGLKVAIISSNKKHLESAQNYLNDKGYFPSVWSCNIADVSSLDIILKNIYAEHGSIDILINSAGILDLSTVEDTTEEMWDSVLDINLKGAFFMTQKCLPYLKAGTHPRVINIASNAGRMGGYANGISYAASKGGMISITYGLARKLGPFGITVNCVAPGTIESDMSRMFETKTREKLLEKFPLGRIGTANEVASAVCYFASRESSFSTGAVLDVNGGMFMG